MKRRAVVVAFLNDICEAFPEMRPLMNRHEQLMTTSKMEEFANETTRAFGVGDTDRAISYLTFMSHQLNPEHKVEYEYIDVYYVENLFWPHGSEAARAGWSHMPENLRELFIKFHGKPPL
jgi:hypothetical protein